MAGAVRAPRALGRLAVRAIDNALRRAEEPARAERLIDALSWLWPGCPGGVDRAPARELERPHSLESWARARAARLMGWTHRMEPRAPMDTASFLRLYRGELFAAKVDLGLVDPGEEIRREAMADQGCPRRTSWLAPEAARFAWGFDCGVLAKPSTAADSQAVVR